MKGKTITLLVGLFLVSSTLFPGNGSAFISHYCASYSGGVAVIPYFYFSNITGSNVSIEIVLYEQNNSSGNPVVLLDGDDSPTTGDVRAENITSYDENTVNGATVKFVIAPYETAVLSINLSSGTKMGYGRIEYSQGSASLITLIAHGVVVVTNSTSLRSERTIPINNGLPF